MVVCVLKDQQLVVGHSDSERAGADCSNNPQKLPQNLKVSAVATYWTDGLNYCLYLFICGQNMTTDPNTPECHSKTWHRGSLCFRRPRTHGRTIWRVGSRGA